MAKDHVSLRTNPVSIKDFCRHLIRKVNDGLMEAMKKYLNVQSVQVDIITSTEYHGLRGCRLEYFPEMCPISSS